MLIAIGQFVLGIPLLVVGAEFLVRGATRLARAMGISSLVVGLTVVAYGTSAPELAVTVVAARAGKSDIGLGNIVGSNIANILVVLGASATVAPLRVAKPVVWYNVPLMIVFSVLLYALAWDGHLRMSDGLLLTACAVVYTASAIGISRRATQRAHSGQEVQQDQPPSLRSVAWSIALVVVGLFCLVWGADQLVDGASQIALLLGVSRLVIGLTIVAVGTSLPELATSCWAAFRGQQDIAVGNAVGSNIINIVAVLGLTAAVAPAGLAVDQDAVSFDLPVMLGVSVASLVVLSIGGHVSRWEGIIFLVYYGVYLATLHGRVTGWLHPGWPTLLLITALPVIVIALSAAARPRALRREETSGKKGSASDAPPEETNP